MKYLFARLNRKRPNNSMQKRNYNTYETADVLPPDEIGNNGVEWFTYCILQISFMAFLIFYFLLSLKEMSVLVGAIHNDKGAKTDKEIKELKEKIQSKQNQ